MRVRFRILLFEGNRRLRKSDLKDRKDPLGLGMRYITEFKYLEATKWLLIAPDSWERYVLLGLINLALGQEEQAREFLEAADLYPKTTAYRIAVERPEEGFSKEIKRASEVIRL